MVKYVAKSERIGIDNIIDIPEGSIGVTITHSTESWVDNWNDRGVDEYLIVRWLELVK